MGLYDTHIVSITLLPPVEEKFGDQDQTSSQSMQLQPTCTAKYKQGVG